MVDNVIKYDLTKEKHDAPIGDARPHIIVGIPAYNEGRHIASVVLRTLEHADLVVVCDDGSEDLTAKIAERMGAVVIRHERNMGYGASIRSIFREARRLGAEVLVTLDGDSQHDPEEIPSLVDKLRISKSDIVIGSRFVEGGSSDAPGWRRAGIRLINDLTSKGGAKVSDAQSGFRAYGKRAVEALALTEDGMGVSTEILVKANDIGLKIAEVPVNVSYGKRSSTHNPVIHGFEVILSTIKYLSMRRPLLFYGLPGVLSMMIALFFYVWTLQIFAETRAISTNIALIAVGATMVGLMLMTTAIILWVIISVIRDKS